MKTFCKNQYKASERSFLEVSRMDFHPTDPVKSFDEMCEEERKQRKKEQIKKKQKALVDDSSIFIDDSLLSRELLSNRDIDLPKTAVKDAIDAVSLEDRDQKADIFTKQVPTPQTPMMYKRSSMQIVEEHLLDKVFIRKLYDVIYLLDSKKFYKKITLSWHSMVSLSYPYLRKIQTT